MYEQQFRSYFDVFLVSNLSSTFLEEKDHKNSPGASWMELIGFYQKSSRFLPGGFSPSGARQICEHLLGGCDKTRGMGAVTARPRKISHFMGRKILKGGGKVKILCKKGGI